MTAAAGWVFGVLALAGIAHAHQETVPLATPIGITVQTHNMIRYKFGVGGTYPESEVKWQYYADASGMALYTYDQDGRDTPSCYDDCALAWPPLIAPRSARAFGEWSLAQRKDGRRQWAHQGKPLYTYAQDSIVGKASGVPEPTEPISHALASILKKALGDDPAGAAGKPAGDDAAATHASWRLAAYQLAKVVAPPGIAVRDVPDANGEALVNAGGMILYAFNGDPNSDRQGCGGDGGCDEPWRPLPAALLANPIGAFAPFGRQDGIRQWTYNGRALYTFVHDLAPGDANGVGIDPRWQPVLLKRFYLPREVRIQPSLGQGLVLATAEGRTLYRQTGMRSHGALPRDVPILPAVGRIVGTRTCVRECLKTWIPLAAPASAQPCGFWQVMVREDGKRQWSYKGYALYRYAGDEQPGDLKGAFIYDIFANAGLQSAPGVATVVASSIVTHNQMALLWSQMYP